MPTQLSTKLCLETECHLPDKLEYRKLRQLTAVSQVPCVDVSVQGRSIITAIIF